MNRLFLGAAVIILSARAGSSAQDTGWQQGVKCHAALAKLEKADFKKVRAENPDAPEPLILAVSIPDGFAFPSWLGGSGGKPGVYLITSSKASFQPAVKTKIAIKKNAPELADVVFIAGAAYQITDPSQQPLSGEDADGPFVLIRVSAKAANSPSQTVASDFEPAVTAMRELMQGRQLVLNLKENLRDCPELPKASKAEAEAEAQQHGKPR